MAAIAGIGASALAQFLQGLGSNNSPPTSSTANPNAPRRAAGAHHRHGQGSFKQIQNAVINALQTAKTSGATTNPDNLIEDAISKILKSGIGASTASGTGTSDTSASTDPASTTSGTQTFKSILQSFGVTPEQFQDDFMSAIKDAQAGQVSPNTALQSFGAGSLLDVIG